MRRTSSARTFTLEVEVSNLTDDEMNELDVFITQVRMSARSMENVLAARKQGDGALVITDEKRSTETADLELF